MTEAQNYEISWWNEWYEADSFERLEKVKKLPFIREYKKVVDKAINEPELKEALAHGIVLQLNSFFEDLTDYMHTKLKEEKDGGKENEREH